VSRGWEHTHYSVLGVSLQPHCSDGNGYIAWRPAVVAAIIGGGAPAHATRGERWIAAQEARITAWRGGGK
jgi:hypothetical protein